MIFDDDDESEEEDSGDDNGTMPSSISTGIVSGVSLSSTALSSSAQAVESDSDDDLVPYDLVESDSDDNDDATPTAGTTVAQIMHGLRDQENADRFHASLVHLPTILRDNVDDIDFDHTAAQLAAQLLRLDNRFALPTFATDRYTALVATCVKCPTAVAKFVCFYVKYFFLFHFVFRLDI